MNVNTALATIALLGGIVGSLGGIYGLVAATVVGLLYIGYDALYRDHHPDGSWSLWIPVDWYNALVYYAAHALYVATCNYWWYCAIVPWNLGSHEYWAQAKENVCKEN